MAFVRKKTKVYPWKVEVKRPSEKNIGEFEVSSFTGKFVRLKRSELNAFEEETEYDALQKILVGWEDVNEEDGTPIQFSKSVLKDFSEDTDFVAGVLDAFRSFYSNAQVGN
jgi:hypothetical protein|tara:strand:+ start:327 stop:659 length:333 start_codon:yes stop_codon:yes gene_type:complete